MASSDVAAASIAAGANMNSTLWTNAANEEMQQQQNKWNLEQWHRTNAYNHPAAQMQRLKAAGLNPDLLYGQNASGAMGNSASPAQGTQPIPKQPFFLDPTMFAQLGLIDAQKKNVDADTQVKLADAEGRQQNNFINQLNVVKTKAILDHINSFLEDDKQQLFDRFYKVWDYSLMEEEASHVGNTAHYNEQYWQSSANIATLLYTMYGMEYNTPLDGAGQFSYEHWAYNLENQGLKYRKLNDLYKSKILG